MAILLPDEFDLLRLVESEQTVVKAFLDGLDDSWYVVPSVGVFDDGKDGEIDVVLASLDGGVFLVEVKGGQIKVNGTRWFQNGKEIDSPVRQVVRARHLLAQRLRTIGLDPPWLNHVVALPDVGDVPREGLGPDAPQRMVLGHRELQFPAAALAAARQRARTLEPHELTRFLHALSPQITLQTKDAALLPVAAQRIDAATRAHLSVTADLDLNPRVLVTGGAGTGKTWLVEQWARRATGRNERTLVICFNRPIADHLGRQLQNDTTMVGTYHDVINRLLEGIYEFDVPPGAGEEYWGTVPTAALMANLDRVERRFDTIIIDEFQDVRHHWMPSIEALFDSSTTKRLLLVADPDQDIYVRDWQPPDGFFAIPLRFNIRSARPVAEVVRRLGGPEPMSGAVGNFPVLHWKATGIKEIHKRVTRTIDRLTNELGVPLSQIAVLTAKTDLRDALMAEDDSRRRLPLVRWEQKNEEAALCETIHRGKGLERAAVVIVDPSDVPNRQLVYIGASRAMWSLTLIGGEALAEMCGVASNSASTHPVYQRSSS